MSNEKTGFVLSVNTDKGYALVSVSKDERVLVPFKIVPEDSPLKYGDVLTVSTESKWSQSEQEKADGIPGSNKLRATKIVSRKSAIMVGGLAIMKKPMENGVKLALLSGPRKGTTVWLPAKVAKQNGIALVEGTPVQVKFLAMGDLRSEIKSLRTSDTIAKEAYALKESAGPTATTEADAVPTDEADKADSEDIAA